MSEPLLTILLVNRFHLDSLLVKHNQLGSMLVSHHLLDFGFLDIVLEAFIVSHNFFPELCHLVLDCSQESFHCLAILCEYCLALLLEGGLLFLAVGNVGLDLNEGQVTNRVHGRDQLTVLLGEDWLRENVVLC
jgi:hypothetical protein